MLDRHTTDLYFECHITIDPIAYDKLNEIQKHLDKFSFRPSKLILRKPVSGTHFHDQEWRDDMFITSRGTDYDDLRGRMYIIIAILQNHGIPARRYKIENTLIDIKV